MIYSIGVWVDKINIDPQVHLCQHFMPVVFLQCCWFIIHKPGNKSKYTV